jgi:uncharacterized protein
MTGEDSRASVRRGDRAKDDAWIAAYLERAPFAFLGTSKDGQPFLNSNLFVFVPDEHVIYMHTARAGRTPDNLEGPTPVALSAASVGRLLPADEALEFSVEYSGVVVFGSGRTITDVEEKERGLQLLLDKYAPHLRPGRDYRPITPEELQRTAVYRIEIESWSGKEKVEASDFEGAFDLSPLPVPFEPGAT